MPMRNDTRQIFDAFVARIAELNHVPVEYVLKGFSVDPAVAQALYEVAQVSSEFMSSINVTTVPQQIGQKIGWGVSNMIGSRTDTSVPGAKREPIDPTDNTGRGYVCMQTNFDTLIRYAKLDAWRHKPEFQTIIRDLIVKAINLTRMSVGWNGTSAAATTDRAANPLGQDLNKGWIQHLREEAPLQILSHGKLDANHIYVDAAGAASGHADFVNLDALVFDAIESLGEVHRDDTDLVAICGRDLVHDKYFNLVNAAGDDATKQVARDVMLSTKKLGGLPAVRVPKFPAGKLVITSLDNLSVYTQEGTERRAIIDQPDRDRIADFQSVNEAYVVEDNTRMVVVENITVGAMPAGNAG